MKQPLAISALTIRGYKRVPEEQCALPGRVWLFEHACRDMNGNKPYNDRHIKLEVCGGGDGVCTSGGRSSARLRIRVLVNETGRGRKFMSC